MQLKTQQALKKALDELRAERQGLDQSIVALEALLSQSTVKRRAARAATTPVSRRKPKWSAAARKAAAERMRQRWASRRKGQA